GGWLPRGAGGRYVPETPVAAELVGIDHDEAPPSEGGLRDYLAGVSGLRLTPGAEEAMPMLLFHPPIPDLLRPAWSGIAAGVIAILPPDVRAIYGLRWFPLLNLPLRAVAFGAGRLFNAWNRVGRLATQADAGAPST